MATQSENGRLDQIEARVSDLESIVSDMRVVVSRIEANQQTSTVAIAEIRGEVKGIATLLNNQSVALAEIRGGQTMIMWLIPVFCTIGLGLAGLAWGIISAFLLP
jgi:hypothetical protein